MATDLSAVHVSAAASGVAPEALRLIASCTADLSSHRRELERAVHERLSELVPDLRLMVTGGTVMCQRLVAAVLGGAAPEPGRSGVRPPLLDVSIARRIGAEDVREGFPPGAYGLVTHALLHALRVVFQGEWTSALSSAWVEYLMWLCSELGAGAADAARPAGVAGRG